MIIADLREVAQSLRSSPPDQRVTAASQAAAALADADLLACLRGLGGWVSPQGLAPRAVFERLAERGLIEAWPGRPLYRARPMPQAESPDAANDEAAR